MGGKLLLQPGTQPPAIWMTDSVLARSPEDHCDFVVTRPPATVTPMDISRRREPELSSSALRWHRVALLEHT